MKPLTYLSSDGNIVSSASNEQAELKKCAEALDKYQADPGFIQNILNSIRGLFGKESKFQARYYPNEVQVFGPNYEHASYAATKLECLSRLEKYKSSSGLSEQNLYNSSLDKIYRPLTELPSFQIFLATLFIITTITALILNIITLRVLARCRKSELTIYLINLSVSDLLITVVSMRKYKKLAAKQLEARL